MAVQVLLRRLDHATLEKVAEISNQNIYRCMQCGTCTAVCPMTSSMELTPQRVVALLQHGRVDLLLESRTPWICASCLTCQVRCPRGIELPRVMEAIRQLMLRRRHDQLSPSSVSAESRAELPQAALVAGFRKLTG
jgi:heterodisulfide reductase subunit C